MRETILVIDDDEKILTMLKRSLSFEGYQVRTATNGKSGLADMLERDPDLVILDRMMPEVDGIEVCRRIRAGGSQVPILMLTARDEVADRVSGLDAGADDYVLKPFALDELLARVRVQLRRKQEAGQANREKDVELQFEGLKLDQETREVMREGRLIELTTKEFELLRMFMINARKVLTRDAIMEKIWGFDFSGESNVLEVYVASLRQKLEEAGEARLIQTVRGVGYVLRKEGAGS
jgi:two-component system, OmpR family, response regulator MprA